MSSLTNDERLENMSPIGYDKDGNLLLKGEDYHFLLEQAELTEELISENRKLREEFADEIKTYAEENARLREALEFYANNDLYFYDSKSTAWDSAVFGDEGNVARQALEREPK